MKYVLEPLILFLDVLKNNQKTLWMSCPLRWNWPFALVPKWPQIPTDFWRIERSHFFKGMEVLPLIDFVLSFENNSSTCTIYNALLVHTCMRIGLHLSSFEPSCFGPNDLYLRTCSCKSELAYITTNLAFQAVNHNYNHLIETNEYRLVYLNIYSHLGMYIYPEPLVIIYYKSSVNVM